MPCIIKSNFRIRFDFSTKPNFRIRSDFSIKSFINKRLSIQLYLGSEMKRSLVKFTVYTQCCT